jgi:lipoyl(octanoyl) transferase
MKQPAANSSSARMLELGLVDYDRARLIQLQLVDKRIDGRITDTFVFVEHPPTITVGRGALENNILASKETLKQRSVQVCETERGGDVTFHGPGQQVIYPIINLEQRGRDLHRFLRDLEEVVINFLGNYDLNGERIPGKTGVWVSDKKICAIGIAVKHWVSYHGLALNLCTDLSYFNLINPCGLPSSTVTSLESLTGIPVDRSRVFFELVNSLENVLQVEILL